MAFLVCGGFGVEVVCGNIGIACFTGVMPSSPPCLVDTLLS
ncbi:DUF3265 domain-containing protein [Vibrio parahaemolyticus]|nr:DUF3265 domain-containing protein [Vibrio parahaemolyticus]